LSTEVTSKKITGGREHTNLHKIIYSSLFHHIGSKPL